MDMVVCRWGLSGLGSSFHDRIAKHLIGFYWGTGLHVHHVSESFVLDSCNFCKACMFISFDCTNWWKDSMKMVGERG